jgi:2-dehydro-3-deoxyphosphogluconate aldolase / (4S)-4-hydroxy-2-oxoglutarate aldolase
MENILKTLGDVGIIPLVRIEDPEKAVPLARAVYEGGLSVIEITFRTEAAEAAIRSIAREVPEIMVGAGTVLSTEQADIAVEAGAKFIVTPGFNPKVVKHCIEKEIPITPGINSPTQIEAALGFGLDTVKFFPAEASGGIKAVKAISAPYGGMKFIPTGGVNTDNLNDYLSFPKILACGGSWMTKGDLLEKDDFPEITSRVRKAVSAMLGFELMHVGIYGNNPEEAAGGAGLLSSMFDFPKTESSGGFMAGKGFEITKKPYLGSRGHIAVGTNYLNRAVFYLEKKGFKVREDSWKEKEGRRVAVYLQDEVLGFALHLLQK